MSTRKEKKRFDALTARILLVLIGISFAAAGYFLFCWNNEMTGLKTAIVLAFAIGGIGITVCGLVFSDRNAINLSEKTGNSELIIYVLLAMGITTLIRKIRAKK